MSSTKRQTGAVSIGPRGWATAIVGVVVLSAVAYFGWTSSYLGARLAGPDTGAFYVPIVRHVLASQTHCYDNGSQYCERLFGTGGQKEFTVAYIFRTEPSRLKSNELYGCYNASTKNYLLTINKVDCRASGYSTPYLNGYTSKSDNFETSTPLFRCYSRDAQNYLVTDDQRECVLSAHTDEIVSLGWVAAAGHLPQRRLQGLCLAVDQAKVLKDSYNSYCNTVEGFSGPSDAPLPLASGESSSGRTPTPITTVAPAVSWQNPNNRLDVNGDGSISPIDVQLVSSMLSAKGAHKLVGAPDLKNTFYVDVNNDGFVSPIDRQLVLDALPK